MKMKMRRPLRLKMLIVVILGLVVSIACFFVGMFALDKYISDVYMDDEHTQKRSDSQIQSFASYVTSHSLRSTDSKALQAWQEQHSNVYILIYNNNDIVFDSDWTIQKQGSYKYIITNYATGEIVVLIQDANGTTREIRRSGYSKKETNNSSSTETSTQADDDTVLGSSADEEEGAGSTSEQTDDEEDSTDGDFPADEADSTEYESYVTSDSDVVTEETLISEDSESDGDEADTESGSDDSQYEVDADLPDDAGVMVEGGDENESWATYYSDSGQFNGTNSIFRTDSATFEYNFYPVLFRDGLFDVCIVDYSDDTLQNAGYIALFLLACAIFVTIVIVYFGREVSRIRRLTDEVIKVSTDDMGGPITKKGSDEICLLAANVDSMRNALIEQLSREKEAWQANSDLVTAMAHDIRTPLTVMAGYLELMSNKDYSSEEELDMYIRISSEKAEQLRMLSDKMFRYFYVYSKGDDSLVMERYEAQPLLKQMIGEYILLMEDNGFTFDVTCSEEKAELMVDVQGMKRITDNIFTNIRKYSDSAKPVEVLIETVGSDVRITFRNHISDNREKAESTRIGTLTCRKMAEEMGGTFTAGENGEIYEAVLTLPNAAVAAPAEKKEKTIGSKTENTPNLKDGGAKRFWKRKKR